MKSFPITIEFFGGFKKYGEQETLHLPANTTIAQLKNLLADHLLKRVQHFSDTQLIHDSAFACNDTIADMNYSIQAGDQLAILPPVCGG